MNDVGQPSLEWASALAELTQMTDAESAMAATDRKVFIGFSDIVFVVGSLWTCHQARALCPGRP
ncbi:hypothetical protein MED297_08041 [Reinekea sp. MED297]|uniref:Uncharacterized protein n=1 Tax=Reinekea blandensis MED297 TaxID=314283 RepID=A4BCU1_9GAMM|nr:hypothetical protein MED297_08041 [Reinekea sp. MED297] [Reinekea blandensis MED297]